MLHWIKTPPMTSSFTAAFTSALELFLPHWEIQNKEHEHTEVITPGNVFDLRFFKGYLPLLFFVLHWSLSVSRKREQAMYKISAPLQVANTHKYTHGIMPTKAGLLLFDVCLWFWLIGFAWVNDWLCLALMFPLSLTHTHKLTVFFTSNLFWLFLSLVILFSITTEKYTHGQQMFLSLLS